MPFTSGIAYSDILLNYQGDLIAIGGQLGMTPLLSGGGGMNGAGTVTSQTYVMGNFWTPTTGAAAAIAETTAVTAPTASHALPTQKTNQVEIHHDKIQLTYMQQSNVGQISGQAVITAPHAIQRPQTQRDAHLLQMAVDIEYALLFGAGQAATNSSTIATTLGVIPGVVNDTTNLVSGSGLLSTSWIEQLETKILSSSGMPIKPVVVGGAFQLQQLKALYGFAEQSTDVGGVTLRTVYLPIIGACGVMYHPQFISANSANSKLAILDMARIRPVFLPVTGRPNVFIEPIGKAGAADQEQIYCQVGCDFDNALYHGVISGLATSL